MVLHLENGSIILIYGLALVMEDYIVCTLYTVETDCIGILPPYTRDAIEMPAYGTITNRQCLGYGDNGRNVTLAGINCLYTENWTSNTYWTVATMLSVWYLILLLLWNGNPMVVC